MQIMTDEEIGRTAYENTYHKVKAGCRYDLWAEIWKLLPPVPPHPGGQTWKWTKLELAAWNIYRILCCKRICEHIALPLSVAGYHWRGLNP
jgi:hypothetical protein